MGISMMAGPADGNSVASAAQAALSWTPAVCIPLVQHFGRGFMATLWWPFAAGAVNEDPGRGSEDGYFWC